MCANISQVKQKDVPQRRELRAAASAAPPKLGMSTTTPAVMGPPLSEGSAPTLGHDPSTSDPPGPASQQVGGSPVHDVNRE